MPLKAIVEHKAIIAHLRKVDRLKDTYMTDCRTASSTPSLKDEIRELYPCEYDQENDDAQSYLKEKYANNSKHIYKGVAHQILGHHNGRIKFKENKLEHYNLYTTALDTYAFFATYLIELSKELTNSHQRANYLIAHLDESFSFDGNLEEKFDKISDIHIHLGAALDFHYRIHDVLKDPYAYVKAKHFEPEELSLDKPAKVFEHRMLIFMSLYESAIITYYTQAEKYDETILYDVYDAMQLLFDTHTSSTEIDQTLSTLMKQYISIRTERFDNEDIAYENDIVSQELLYRASNYFKKNDTKGYEPKIGDKALVTYLMQKLFLEDENTLVYRMIEGYLIMRNIFKSIIYQQHRRSGFGYFTSYSRNSMKKATNNAEMKHIFKSILHPEISTNAEVRIGIHKYSKDLHEWFSLLHRTVCDLPKTSEVEYRIKSIFHYLKRKNKSNESIRFQSNREAYKDNTYVLNQFLTDKSVRYCLNDKRKSVDLAYHYFHGIDAASNELYVPPEVFAPVYSFFKNSVISSGFAIATDECVVSPKRIDLQYTYHVGEEYRDILSGLRAIFEAIIFLNLKDEDRLGHAVALGIDATLFLNERKHITLTKGEYMDNLVFLYYILFNTCDSPICSLEEIRSTIEQLGNEIYGDISNEIGRSFTIDDYIAGWLLRRNCPLQIDKIVKYIGGTLDEHAKTSETAWLLREYIKKNDTFLDTYISDGFERAYLKASLPDFFNHTTAEDEPLKRYLSIRNSQKAYVIYWAYASNTISDAYDKYYEGNVLFSTDVYTYTQDYMMENYVAKRDIVIEIMPTSNLLITSIGNYANHPFLRLNPPLDIVPNKFNIRTKKIKIALGTDDPGIHGTSLMMEYHILNDVISKEYGKRVAEKYLTTLADFGNYLFEKGKKG